MTQQEKPTNPKPKSKPEPTADPKIIAFLAFFPITGILGIHDILAKKYWGCILRIVVISLIVFSIFDTLSIIKIHIPPRYPQIFTIISMASPFILVALYAWAFAEGLQMSKTQQAPKNIPDKDSDSSVPSDKSKAQALNTPSDIHDTLYYKSDLSDGMKEMEERQKQEPPKKEYAPTISFVCSAVLLSFWGNTLFIDPDSVGCTGGDMGLFILGILATPISVIVATIAITLGLTNLKAKSRGLIIASFIMTALSIVSAIRFFAWIPTICSY